MMKRIRIFIAVMLCMVMITGLTEMFSQPVQAAAGKKAVKFLKGRWYSNSMMEEGKPTFYVKFTRKYAKYYYYQTKTNKYKYQGKCRIVSAKKSGKGYLIKLKNKSGKFCYQTDEKDKKILNCFQTWESDKFWDYYSASSSLGRDAK